MRTLLGKVARYTLISATLALACASGSGNSSQGRGTAACNEWQTAVCAWSSKCGSASAATCPDLVNAITCNSDQKAHDCATLVNAAPCTAPPTGCGAVDLADPAPAVAACNQLVDESCASNVRCNPTISVDQCRLDEMSALDCTKAIGVKTSFDTCITALRALPCDALSLPEICKGVLVKGA